MSKKRLQKTQLIDFPMQHFYRLYMGMYKDKVVENSTKENVYLIFVTNLPLTRMDNFELLTVSPLQIARIPTKESEGLTRYIFNLSN